MHKSQIQNKYEKKNWNFITLKLIKIFQNHVSFITEKAILRNLSRNLLRNKQLVVIYVIKHLIVRKDYATSRSTSDHVRKMYINLHISPQFLRIRYSITLEQFKIFKVMSAR